MTALDFGYLANPANGLGIVRARTLIGNLRLWDIPRSERALDTIIMEIGTSPIPGLYMLFDERHGKKKVYIGQTENLKSRLSHHINSPEHKIRNWDRAIVINDGRNASQSDINDENIRLTLENYLVRLFKINRYTVTTSASRSPSLSATQKTVVNTFKQEILILLTRKTKISKALTERGDDEVYNDEVHKLLSGKGHHIAQWKKRAAIVDQQPAFLRPGSAKKSGWQVTFRGNKPNSFKTKLEEGDGFLLMPRGPVLLIPLEKIKMHIISVDNTAFSRDTMDVFIRFDSDKIALVYKGNEMDVTPFAVAQYPPRN